MASGRFDINPGKVQVRIFDDRLEVWNPGFLTPPLTLEKLKGKHDSVPRNPLIAKMFFWIKYAEDVGSGTNKIIQWCKEWGLPEPTYEEAGASFVTVFHNPKPEEGGQKDLTRLGVRLGVNETKIIDMIAENKFVTIVGIAETLGISTTAVEKNIARLREKGILRREGSDKGGHWEVND